MPIQVTNKDIGTRGITSANLSDFAGRDRQVVIQVDDPKGYRPVIMDGITVGGKNKVALVDDLDEYAKKTEVPEVPPAPDLSPYATKANPAFTGTATLNAKTIATTDQIPDTSGFLTESDLTEIEAGITDLQEQISEKNPDYGTLGALPDNNVTQLSNLKVTNSTLADYAGVNAQLVYNTDNKQWVSMDGTTQGGANTLVNAKGYRGNLEGYEKVSQQTGSSAIYTGYNYPDVIIADIEGITSPGIWLGGDDTAGSGIEGIENAAATKIVLLLNASLEELRFVSANGITSYSFIGGEVPVMPSETSSILLVLFYHGTSVAISYSVLGGGS